MKKISKIKQLVRTPLFKSRVETLKKGQRSYRRNRTKWRDSND